MDNKNENKDSRLQPAAQEAKKSLSSEEADWLENLFQSDKLPEKISEQEQPPISEIVTPGSDLELELIMAEIKYDNSMPMLHTKTTDEKVAEILAEEGEKETLETDDATIVVPQEIPEDFSANPIDDTEIVEDEDPEELEPIAEPEVPKGRPKKENREGLFGIPRVISTAIWLVLIVAIGVSIGRILWICCAEVMAFGKESHKVTITITEDDDIESISNKLAQANLIRYPGLFKFFAEVTGKDDNITPGTFALYSHFDYNAMINAMVSYDSRETVDIMFTDGANCAQIFKLLEENNVCTVAELEKYAASGELADYWFLEGVPRGDRYCLEGYLAPDTYTFYTNDEPRRVLEKFLNEFDSRFTNIMKDDFESMQVAYANMLKNNGMGNYAKEHPLTLHQVVTLASVIQREAASINECYDIASAFYNRLTHPNHMSLGSDATVYYAIGDYFGEVEELTQSHLNVDSPYNTRKNKGFPPGPICNMGVHSLYAALEPNDTNYYYFVFDQQLGEHRFATTYNEHLNNIEKVGG